MQKGRSTPEIIDLQRKGLPKQLSQSAAANFGVVIGQYLTFYSYCSPNTGNL